MDAQTKYSAQTCGRRTFLRLTVGLTAAGTEVLTHTRGPWHIPRALRPRSIRALPKPLGPRSPASPPWRPKTRRTADWHRCLDSGFLDIFWHQLTQCLGMSFSFVP